MEAASSSETLVNIYQTTQSHITEDNSIHNHHLGISHPINLISTLGFVDLMHHLVLRTEHKVSETESVPVLSKKGRKPSTQFDPLGRANLNHRPSE
jgi:hypothetical protein